MEKLLIPDKWESVCRNGLEKPESKDGNRARKELDNRRTQRIKRKGCEDKGRGPTEKALDKPKCRAGSATDESVPIRRAVSLISMAPSAQAREEVLPTAAKGEAQQ